MEKVLEYPVKKKIRKHGQKRTPIRSYVLTARALLLALAMILSLALPICLETFAGEETGVICIICSLEREGENICLLGDTYSIVQIAQARLQTSSDTRELEYQICPEYTSYDCDWQELSASQLNQKAELLAQEVQKKQAYLASSATDSQGQVVFDGLEPGMYLIMRTEILPANAEYTSAPFLVSIPLIWNGSVAYTVTAAPKFSWENIPEELLPEEETPMTGTEISPKTGPQDNRWFLLFLADVFLIVLILYKKTGFRPGGRKNIPRKEESPPPGFN